MHDAAVLVMSCLYPLLEIHSHNPNCKPLAIYGDPAYPHRVHLQCQYKGANLSNARQFNASMTSVRVAVEWPFGDIATYFAFNDFKKNLKIDQLQRFMQSHVYSLMPKHVFMVHKHHNSFGWRHQV